MPLSISIIARGLFLFFVTISSAATYAHTSLHQQQWFGNGPVAVPAKKIYDGDAKSWYAVYNTGNIVHVYLAVTDPAQQKKVIMNGIDLWIDTKGKKSKKTGILFPYIVQPEKNNNVPPPPSTNEQPGRYNDQAVNDIPSLEKIIATRQEMKLTGFKEDLNGVQGIQHPSGIRVRMYFSKDTLLYEAQLPLNTLAETVLVNSRISIGIVEKGKELNEQDGNMPMPPPGGDGMMPPPPGPGGMDGNRMRQAQDDIIWYKFSLSDSVAQ